MIRISNKDIQNKLGIRGKYAAFSDLVDLEVTEIIKFQLRLIMHMPKLPVTEINSIRR